MDHLKDELVDKSDFGFVNKFDPHTHSSLIGKIPGENSCNQRAEMLMPFQWYACVLPKGHEGEHKGGGQCVIHGEYVGIRGCPTCISTNYKEFKQNL